MKKRRNICRYIIILSLWEVINCFGQSQAEKNLNIIRPNQPVVSTTNFNVVYNGIENPIAIAIPNVPSEAIYIKVSLGTVSGANGKYLITPKENGQLTIFIYSVLKKDTIYYGEYGFRVLKLPTPIAYVAGISDSSKIQKSELAAAHGVVCKFNWADFDLQAKIVSFELKVGVNKQKNVLKSNNNLFTNEIKEVFNKAKSGDEFQFQNIKSLLPDGSERILNSIRIKI
ncbi:MAG: hypothetical protein IT235_04760, partial [Bacteroidia bacterium]|nr:hypothetical protein [Bacteroidia bacterium]